MDFEFILRQLLTGVGGFMAVSATFILGRKFKSGFIIKALAQLPVIYIAVVTSTWGLLCYSLPLITVSLWDWYNWRKSERKED